MFEYYAWANILIYTNVPDELSVQKFRKEEQRVLSIIKEEISRINYEGRILQIDVKNGHFILWASSFSNHRNQDVDEMFALFNIIKTIAPGSYGLIYTRDIDDPIIGNEFKVWKLAKGELEEMNDPFLSPCIPVIEDEEEADEL